MEIKNWPKQILTSGIMLAGGFVLFNAAFLLFAGIFWAMEALSESTGKLFNPSTSRLLAYLCIMIISGLILSSRLKVIVKATILELPLMVTLVMAGIYFYGKPIYLLILFCAAIIAVVVAYIMYRKLSWQYYFAVASVTVLGVCIMIFNIQI
ncbi:MAG: hypothetical protein RBT04_04795 [Sphaerochaetaceae bacterium]|jgi:Na+-driven multidrug efflux pump|nr:hypothetical protein [Sphaerochaetaceae bacterium]